MNNYSTVSEALNDLFKRGYTLDFALLKNEDCIYCHQHSHSLNADEFEIDEVYRFEGETDPGDEMIVFAISSTKHQVKGTLLNAFGMYADADNSKIIEKLTYKMNNPIKPLKRAKELIQLSKEHHHALLLSWKIKTGLAKNVDTERIAKYVHWFFENHLIPHFDIEEKYLFPLLGTNNANVTKALEQHVQIRQLMSSQLNKENLTSLQNLVTAHVRFEERVLFNEIQDEGDLKSIQEFLNMAPLEFCDNEIDPFWK